MEHKRRAPQLSGEGEFYRRRDDWVRHIMGLKEWDASWRVALVAIAMRANPKSQTPYPKQERISEDTGVHPRTVRRAIQEAVNEGLLVVSKRRPLFGPKGAKPVNHYLLISPSEAERKHRACRCEVT